MLKWLKKGGFGSKITWFHYFGPNILRRLKTIGGDSFQIGFVIFDSCLQSFKPLQHSSSHLSIHPPDFFFKLVQDLFHVWTLFQAILLIYINIACLYPCQNEALRYSIRAYLKRFICEWNKNWSTKRKFFINFYN